MSEIWAVFAEVHKAINLLQKTGEKMFADGAFASTVLDGCVLAADGQSYKVTLDDRTSVEQAVVTATPTLWIIGNSWMATKLGKLGPRTISDVQLYIMKQGTPPNPVTVEIQEGTDAGGPNGTVVGSSISKNAADIPLVGGVTWITFAAVNATTELNKYYYLIVKTTDGDGSNCYGPYGINGGYLEYFKSTDGGSTWVKQAGYMQVGYKLTATKATAGIVTQAIADTSLGKFSKAFHTVDAGEGAITIDVEDSSGNDLKAGVASEQDISDIVNPEQHTTFQLKANLSRAAAADDTPALKWWGISYIGDTV